MFRNPLPAWGATTTLVLSVAVTCGVFGCATSAQRQAAEMRQTLESGFQQLQACADGVNRRFNSLSDKIVLDPQSYDIELLSSPKVPSDSEIEAIFERRNALQPCRRSAIESAGSVHALLANVMANTYLDADKLYVALATERLTYGEFNRRLMDIVADHNRRWVQASSEIDQQLQGAHEAELVYRQRAAQAFQQWSYQQQLLNALRAPGEPTYTNCYLSGNVVNCTSY